MPLIGTVFAIGKSPKCNLQLKEASVSSVLCNLVWQEGTAYIECLANSGILSVNQQSMRKNARQQLKHGDEIAISGLKPILFVRTRGPL